MWESPSHPQLSLTQNYTVGDTDTRRHLQVSFFTLFSSNTHTVLMLYDIFA